MKLYQIRVFFRKWEYLSIKDSRREERGTPIYEGQMSQIVKPDLSRNLTWRS